jgi:hypothetical protein
VVLFHHRHRHLLIVCCFKCLFEVLISLVELLSELSIDLLEIFLLFSNSLQIIGN